MFKTSFFVLDYCTCLWLSGVRVQVSLILETIAPKGHKWSAPTYCADPGLINRVPASNIEVAVRDASGNALFVPVAERSSYPAMDGTEVVWQYLRDNLGGKLSNLETHRINLLRALPAPVFGNYEVQALRGAQWIVVN